MLEEMTYTNDLTVVKFKLLHPDAILPKYAHPTDSGMDLRSVIKCSLNPMEIMLVDTGLAISMPNHLEAQVRPRSGLAAKYGISIVNSPGTVDAGYTGEIKVILINLSKQVFEINKGDRIAQLVFAPVVRITPEVVITIDKTDRATNGFGSTGVK